jgi:hypothetical protein
MKCNAIDLHLCGCVCICSVQYVVSLLFASLCYLLISGHVFSILFMFVFLFCTFTFCFEYGVVLYLFVYSSPCVYS